MYLSMYDEYIDNLIIAIHVGSGMPASATEIENYRIQNGMTMTRNVFWQDGPIFLQYEHS